MEDAADRLSDRGPRVGGGLPPRAGGALRPGPPPDAGPGRDGGRGRAAQAARLALHGRASWSACIASAATCCCDVGMATLPPGADLTDVSAACDAAFYLYMREARTSPAGGPTRVGASRLDASSPRTRARLVVARARGSALGAADGDRVGFDGDGHRAVTRPVLRVHGVVHDRGIEPQAVALLLAVVERGLERVAPGPVAAASAAAATPAAAARLAVDLLVVLVVARRPGFARRARCARLLVALRARLAAARRAAARLRRAMPRAARRGGRSSSSSSSSARPPRRVPRRPARGPRPTAGRRGAAGTCRPRRAGAPA